MRTDPFEFRMTHEELCKVVMRNCVEGHLTVLQAMYMLNTYQRLTEKVRQFAVANRWPQDTK